MDKTASIVLRNDIRIITSVEDERIRDAVTSMAFDDARSALSILAGIVENADNGDLTIWINRKPFTVTKRKEGLSNGE